MEKRKNVKLVVLLLRYTITCLIVAIVWILVFWYVINIAIITGFISTADAAEKLAKESSKNLKINGSFDKAFISPKCDYILFSKEGDLLETSLEGSSLKKSLAAYKDNRNDPDNMNGKSGYYISVQLKEGTCFIQYKFRTWYRQEEWNKWLPDFQILSLILMLVLLFASYCFIAFCFVKKLKRHLKPLNASVEQLAIGNLEKPFGVSGICEFDEVMDSMDHLRAALKDSMIEKWQMEQEQRVQTAALVHDIKTPLTVIQGNAELLEENMQGEEDTLCIHAIQKNVESAQLYIEKLNQIMKRSASEEKKHEIVGGKEILNKIKMEVQEICKIKKILLNFKDVELQNFYADEQAVLRSIINIVDNACRYTPGGKCVQVVISCDNVFFKITVQDEGPGFTNEALIHALDLFYTENENRNPEGHSGIGLAYANRVAKQHGGKLEIGNSSDGHGLVCFSIRIDS